MLTQQEENLISLLDGYVEKGGHHLNVNVFNKDTLIDAQKHPEKYPQLTVRVSGYAVNFIKLTKEQQDDIISRTFHSSINPASDKTTALETSAKTKVRESKGAMTVPSDFRNSPKTTRTKTPSKI